RREGELAFCASIRCTPRSYGFTFAVLIVLKRCEGFPQGEREPNTSRGRSGTAAAPITPARRVGPRACLSHAKRPVPRLAGGKPRVAWCCGVLGFDGPQTSSLNRRLCPAKPQWRTSLSLAWDPWPPPWRPDRRHVGATELRTFQLQLHPPTRRSPLPRGETRL